jgi:NADPH-dependent 2,4-dienoyl-CoA reductase/sulfur reductase-like enzyme
MNFLIIGGDAAGMSAASRAKRRNPDMNVTVLEMTEDVSYSACGMPYNIADPERDIEDLVIRRAEVFREKQNIHLLTGHKAESIERSAKTVSGTKSDGTPFTLPYDNLLIATGAMPVRPAIPGADLPAVMTLNSLDEGRQIKSALAGKAVQKVVLIGMGYIALEMCECLHERGIAVEMVKPRTGLLPWLDREMADAVRAEIESRGVAVHDGMEIQRIEAAGPKESGESDGPFRVICDGPTLEADLVLVGIGVAPNSRIAEAAGLELGPQKAIAVDKRMRTSDPDIFAAGDCADAFHIVGGHRVFIPLALRANRAGWAAADNVTGAPMELPGVAGTAVFKIFDYQVARTGLTVAEAEKAGFEPVSVTIKAITRAHVYPGAERIWVHMVGDKKSGRLLGAQMVAKETAAHRINAPAVGLQAGMTVAEFVQSDLAYAPPFGPVWDPALTAANQLLKKLK